jgi:hypothetical protein
MSNINPFHTIPYYLSKIHFNIVQSPTSWSSQWSLSFWPFHWEENTHVCNRRGSEPVFEGLDIFHISFYGRWWRINRIEWQQKCEQIKDRDRRECLKNDSSGRISTSQTLPAGMIVIVTETVHILQQQYLVAEWTSVSILTSVLLRLIKSSVRQ